MLSQPLDPSTFGALEVDHAGPYAHLVPAEIPPWAPPPASFHLGCKRKSPDSHCKIILKGYGVWFF